MLQRSSEWFEARCGLPTASCFNQLISVKGEKQKAYMGYLYQLVGERISGISERSYQSTEMKIGIEREDEARRVYAMENEVVVDDDPGFILHPSGLFGGSPDGLVNHNGGVEIKNKLMKNHIATLANGRANGEYFQQIHGYMLVTGREWWDYFSYFPRLPHYQERIYRDEDWVEKAEKILIEFSQEIDYACEKIMGAK